MPDESEERAMLDAMMNDIDEVMPEDRKMEFYRLLIPQLRRSGEMSDSEYEGLMGELFGEGKADGGIMNLGGNEMDLRGGGFVPLGAKEKADDVPARLSKNEFVMTADAVRAAGGGSVDKGADKMYKMMKQLEAQV
jgi:DNA-directed RNA polymerase delta subunit